MCVRGGMGGAEGRRKEKREENGFSFLPLSFILSFPLLFKMSRTRQRRRARESHHQRYIPIDSSLAHSQQKAALIKEEEEEDGGESETENENPMKASPSLSFFQESLCSPLAGCRTIR